MTGWLERLLRPECRHVHRVINAWLDGELPPEQAHRVAAHLADCDRCGVEAETCRRVKESLAAAAPLLRPSIDPAALRRLQRFADELITDE